MLEAANMPNREGMAAHLMEVRVVLVLSISAPELKPVPYCGTEASKSCAASWMEMAPCASAWPAAVSQKLQRKSISTLESALPLSSIIR